MASPPSSSGRRRTTQRQYSAEDQALNQIAREAEGRIAARRAARAEARDIRMRELERQQREAEEKQDRHFELTKDSSRPTRTTYSNSNSTRRGSDDSTEDKREVKRELQDLEDKFKKAMMNNAQIDNEKQAYRYQVEVLKDKMEEMEEGYLELQREHKDRCRDLDHTRREQKDLNSKFDFLKEQLEHRDKLIEEHGLVFVSNDDIGDDNGKGKKKGKDKDKEKIKAALVTPEAAKILQNLGEGSLDDTLKKIEEEKRKLEEENKKLSLQLEKEKERSALAEKYSSPKPSPKVNGPDMQLLEIQMDAQKQVSEYKFKLTKAEQDITQLEGNVIRLESQVKRYKTASENSEKVEEELKQEKRKLQRELRESQNTIEEFQTSNHHLQKRLEKLKSSRNALVKP